MPTNFIKKYNDLLDLNHLNDYQRKESLRAIFDRDIAEKDNFNFRTKIIRPIKKDGVADVEILFKHLTYRSDDEYDNKGKVIKKRDFFDFERSKRLHWISPHIDEKTKEEIKVFSSYNRINGKNVTRTYIFNEKEKYVIVLEPQRSGLDYYFITAYYLEEKYGGSKPIIVKYKNRLEEVF